MFAYIDPGTGFPFLTGVSFLWAVILGFLGIFLLFIKRFFRLFKNGWWITFILIIVFLIFMIMRGEKNMGKKIVILGIDAMDPNITERLMAEGRLPNFAKLKNMGSYSRLKTTIPSESVVAWTSFATGLNPGAHGIFDFIMREPSSYMPYLSLSEVKPDTKEISFGKMRIPFRKLKIDTRRKGKTFWDILTENNIPSYIYFCPNTFPAQRVRGKMLSGMGVPDLYGTMGRFLFYTTKPIAESDKESRGKIVSVERKNNLIETYIFGPRVIDKGEPIESKLPLKISLNPKGGFVEIEFQNKHSTLKEGSWSDWQEISFKTGFLQSAYGIVKFYLKSIAPDFELYLSPINFDPRRPLFPISYPRGYSGKLARKLGLYFTQGMPHDTWALTESRFNEKEFLEHVDAILEEKEKILAGELRDFKAGVFFFYFETLDIIQHMFWRHIDPKHPLYETNSKYKNVISEYYEKMDEILGSILRRIDKDTTLIVLSDHGFSSFRRAVHLNRWLLEQGFLYLKEGFDEGKELFEGIDWLRTRAYALGFGGIYFNKIGRERYGIVNEAETESLKEVISQRLRQWKDSQTGETVVSEVYKKDDIFSGPYRDSGPDLFVGFNSGYRASWQTALGAVPQNLIEDNKKKWSGDHLIDPKLVPGVIFTNKKIDLNSPSIIDITPTILAVFNIRKPGEMQGKVLFIDETH